MKRIRLILAALLLAAPAALPLRAQNPGDLRITEILVENTQGLTDRYGERNGWIEVFNNSNGTVRFGGCYLSDDPADLKKYHIPSTDRSTTVGPRQSVVFHASGDASKGTYYTNFKLRRGTTVYLVSNDGRTVIDCLEIPADLEADKSVMKVPVGIKETDFQVKSNADPTPGSYNGDVDAKTKSQIMKEKDPTGLVLVLISVSTVFLSLTILAFVFGWIGNASQRMLDGGGKKKRRKAARKGAGAPSPEVATAIAMALDRELGGEIYAAIALALHQHLASACHDTETYRLTIRHAGAGWNNKALNFRQLPKK